MYQPRIYRNWVQDKELVSYSVIVEETDLYIRTSCNLKGKAISSVCKYRKQIESYIELHPEFAESFKPLVITGSCPHIIKEMIAASEKFDVGPMAAVAGAIAEFVGKDLLSFSHEVIIENGGDIFISSKKNRTIAIYAGNSSLSGKYGIEIEANDTPLGICTSSGTVGHSFSFGKADAAVITADSASIADAAATAICNMVTTKDDIDKAIVYAKRSGLLKGVIIIKDEAMGVWGNIKLCELSQNEQMPKG
ncbi:MAG: UPF0280 family protein [Dehalococcoidales bacterium]|nr:UPF0280 family protein [Dehalococcoidales bacterium]